MTVFQQKVKAVVMTLKRGKVTSYGAIATHLGNPSLARQVGWALRQMEPDESMPWWRVINSKGYISIKGNITHNAHMQKELLVKDGVVVNANFEVDMAKYNQKL